MLNKLFAMTVRVKYVVIRATFPNFLIQMKQKVARMTKLFLKEGGGKEEQTAKLLANFMSQRLV